LTNAHLFFVHGSGSSLKSLYGSESTKDADLSGFVSILLRNKTIILLCVKKYHKFLAGVVLGGKTDKTCRHVIFCKEK
jgi:hypothetical protein